MSARSELVARVRAGFRGVMLSNHTADLYCERCTKAELELLDRMFSDELGWREASKRERLLKAARFPVPKTFEGYDWSHVRLPDGMPRSEIETAGFVGRCQNLVLYGGVGNGKTHMAIAAGSAACRGGLRVMFSTVADLLMRMSAAGDGRERVFREVERADLVVLDEFGYLPIDRDGARLLFQVVSRCYERRSLVVTTNLEFSKWGAVLADDQMAAALIDRVVHYGHLVVFDGPTKRMEASPMNPRRSAQAGVATGERSSCRR